MDYKHKFKYKNDILRAIGNLLHITRDEADSKLSDNETSKKCLFVRCVKSCFIRFCFVLLLSV